MSFFAVLLALVIEQLRPLPRDNSVHDALVAWTRWIGRNFDAGRDHHAWVVWVLTVGLPTALVFAVHYALANDTRSLVWMANQNSVTPHVWCARVPTLERPDLCIFDLDPAGDDPKPLRAAALAVRDLLDELGLPSFVKTSGSKGFHIMIPLDGEGDFETSWRFTHGAGAVLVKRHPDLMTQEFIKADRAGRIFVDTGRNGPGATCAAVYAVRPKPGAPVSAPCTWQEIESGAVEPRTFTLRTMAERIAAAGDLWKDIETRRCSLRAPLATLEGLLTEDDWKESMAATTRRPTSRKSPRKR